MKILFYCLMLTVNSCLFVNAQVVNVSHFGAKGDGITDDWSSIQKAIDFAFNNKSNKVYLPNGNYLINKTLIISGSDLIIEGEDKDKTVLIKKGNPGWWGDLMYVCGYIYGSRYFNRNDVNKEYTYKGVTIPSSNIVIQNLSFLSSSSTDERINNIGVVNTVNLSIRNCNFNGSPNTNLAIVNDAKLHKNLNVKILNCLFKKAKSTNLRVTSYNQGAILGNSVEIKDSFFYETGTGFSKELKGNKVHLWYRAGLGGENISLNVENCFFDDSGLFYSTVNNNNLSISKSELKGGYHLENNKKNYPNSIITLKENKIDSQSIHVIKGTRNVR